jgi:oxalate decarboxylase/phosphoglucose isomerase-like protein (cupin superfamily)
MENSMKMQTMFNKTALVCSVCGLAFIGVPLTSQADEVPASFQASPDVYKVLAENDEMRIGVATWKPGQKDNSHSHPKAAFYTVKECHARITASDGKVKEVNNKAGTARINPPVKSHTFENIGTTECQQVFVELKK